MVQRLFLDRVNAEARGTAIGGEQDCVTTPRTHEAQPALAVVELAVSGAEVALDAAVGKPLPITTGNALQRLTEPRSFRIVHSP